MAGRLYRMAKVVSANPKSWGIVDANEISGFKRVAKLADLYSIAECILSSSYGDGVTDGADAVGQIWHVSETNGDYKLTNWASRKSAAGWTKLSYGGDVSVPVKDVQVTKDGTTASVLSNGIAKIDLTPYAKTSTTNMLTNNVNSLQTEINNTNATVGALSGKVTTLKSNIESIDTTVYEVIGDNALPTTGIKKRIYLKLIETGDPTGDNNKYAEYVYTADPGATYDATKWEKLGEVAAKTDLSEYYKKTEVDGKLTGLARTLTSQDVEDFTIIPSFRGEQGVGKLYYMQASIRRKGGDPLSAIIPCVVSAADTTNANAGLMSPADKEKLDTVEKNANAYTHPTRSADASDSEGLYKITVNALGHVSKTTAVTNADIDPLVTVDSTLNTYSTHPVSGAAVNKYINSKKITTDNLTAGEAAVPNGDYIIPFASVDGVTGYADNKLTYTKDGFIIHCDDNNAELNINGVSFWNSSNLTPLTDEELNTILK